MPEARRPPLAVDFTPPTVPYPAPGEGEAPVLPRGLTRVPPFPFNHTQAPLPKEEATRASGTEGDFFFFASSTFTAVHDPLHCAIMPRFLLASLLLMCGVEAFQPLVGPRGRLDLSTLRGRQVRVESARRPAAGSAQGTLTMMVGSSKPKKIVVLGTCDVTWGDMDGSAVWVHVWCGFMCDALIRL